MTDYETLPLTIETLRDQKHALERNLAAHCLAAAEAREDLDAIDHAIKFLDQHPLSTNPSPVEPIYPKTMLADRAIRVPVQDVYSPPSDSSEPSDPSETTPLGRGVGGSGSLEDPPPINTFTHPAFSSRGGRLRNGYPIRRRVYTLLADHGPGRTWTAREVAKTIGNNIPVAKPDQAILSQLRRLAEHGLLERQPSSGPFGADLYSLVPPLPRGEGGSCSETTSNAL